MFFSALIMASMSATAQAGDPALELLRRYSNNADDPEIAGLLEAVAIDRMNDRVSLLPDAVRNVNVNKMVSDQTRWYYDGLSMVSASDNLLSLTSGELAERAIMDHLVLPPPTWLGKRQHGGSQAAKISASSGEHFRVVPSNSYLSMEYGVDGNGNGNFDLGEWAVLSVAIEPIGKPIYFSTSATVESADACVWAKHIPNAAANEFIVGEFRSVRDPEPVSVMVYVSEDCRPGSVVQLSMTVKETKLGGREDRVPIRLRIGQGHGNGLGIEPKWDHDDAGYSENAAPPFHLNSQSELSVNVKGREAPTVLQRHIIPGPKGAVKVKESERSSSADDKRSILAPMVSISTGFWVADNDLDFEVGSSSEVGKWIRTMNRSWSNGADPLVPFATDVFFYPNKRRQFSRAEKIEIAIEQFHASQAAAKSIDDRVANVKKLSAFQTMVAEAYANPTWRSSEEVFQLVDDLFAAGKPAPEGTGGYAYRRIHMVPIGYEHPRAAPPPPPIVEEPEVVEDKEPTTFAFSFGVFNPHIFRKVYDTQLTDLSQSGTIARLLFGTQVQAFVDLGGLAEGTSTALFEGTFGARYNVLFLPEVRLGPHLGVGFRNLSVLGESETNPLVHGGVSVDVFPTRNIGLWIQASAASPSPEYVGKDSYRAAVQSRRIAWGVEVAF